VTSVCYTCSDPNKNTGKGGLALVKEVLPLCGCQLHAVAVNKLLERELCGLDKYKQQRVHEAKAF
jgi:hypothetical protein